MQSKSTLAGLFLVNGTKCQVQLDEQSIRWCSVLKAGKCEPTNGDDGGQTTKGVRKITFDQVIGVSGHSKGNTGVPGSSGAKYASYGKLNHGGARRIKIYYAKQNENKSTGRLLKFKKVSIESLGPATEQAGVGLSLVGEGESNIAIDSRTSAAQLNAQDNNNKEAQHQASAPPSCYASEGSTGHLSSSTCSSSSPPGSTLIENDLVCDSNSKIGAGKANAIKSRSFQPAEQADNSTKGQSGRQQQASQSKNSFDRLIHLIKQNLELKRKHRPKRLLVFVNPFGGKGRAVRLYKSQVQRLLSLAGIEATLIVTKYANHARDTVEDPLFSVDYFDGIICVGGDGMFSELMNGLLFRYNREKVLTAALELSARSSDISKEIDPQGDMRALPTSDAPTISTSAFDHNANDSENGNNSTSSCSSERFTGSGSGSGSGSSSSSSSSSSTNTTKGHQTQMSDEQRLSSLRSALGGIGRPFVSPPIPIGVIGAGSTDANSFGLIGTNDVITATLNIILGNQIKIDVCSVHSIQEDRLLRFVSTFVAYGYFGDVIRESERLRWLGPSRYDVTGVNTLIKNRTYMGQVNILTSSQDGSPLDLERCHTNCQLCYDSQFRQQNDLELSFTEKRGSFIGINAAVTACRCPQTRKGFSPSNHLANGCLDLILVRPCTRMQYIQYLLRTGWTKKSAFDLKYVEAYRCRQFEFLTYPGPSKSNPSEASNSSSSSVDHGSNANSLDSKQSDQFSKSLGSSQSSWNVDGEILNEQSIRVKVNNQLLRVFGTGEPQ